MGIRAAIIKLPGVFSKLSCVINWVTQQQKIIFLFLLKKSENCFLWYQKFMGFILFP